MIGIYCILNIVNNKKYIGSSKNISNRFNQHIRCLKNNTHVNIKLQRAFIKYGISNLKLKILELCDKSKLYEREQFYLDTIKPFQHNGYNICMTSCGGDNLTNHPNRNNIIKRITNTVHNTYANMSEYDKTQKFGNRSDVNNANFGNHWNNIQKKKQSKIMKEYYSKNDHIAKNKTFDELYGKEQANIKKIKISEFAKTRIGGKNGFYNKRHTNKTKAIISAKNKNNIPLNRMLFTINEILYYGLYDAEKKTGINYSTIQYRLKSTNHTYLNIQ